jgi:hypothetical protein
MNPTRIAEAIRNSRDQATEIDGPINFYVLAMIGISLGVQSREVYVSCGSGEKLRVSVPGAKPIRSVPMGEKP